MPPTFRQRPSRRRERGLKANCLVLGFSPSDIRHGDCRAVLVPFRAERDAKGEPLPRPHHHWKRFAVGQLLAVKEYVPGPTAFNVRLVYVHGPMGDGSLSGQSFTLGDVSPQIARELGHFRLDAFRRHWVVNHDQDWYVDHLTDDGPATDDQIEERFTDTWAGTPVWLLRFDIETGEEAARFLARGGGASDYKTGADKRWYHAPRSEDEERDSDRGYTGTLSLASDELPGLSDSDWEKHVGPKSPYRIAERVHTKKAETWQSRYATAKVTAREARRDIRSECRRFDLLMAQGKTEKAMRQLELIEARCYPVAA